MHTTAEVVLETIIAARRRDRSADCPWECWRPEHSVESHLVVALWTATETGPYEGLHAAFVEAELHLLALQSAGLLILEREPMRDPRPPGDEDQRTHTVWFAGEALERLGPAPVRRTRRDIAAPVRYTVLERDDFECVLCGAADDLTLDHIIPVVMGGSDDPINLRVLCRSCNSNKGTGLPDVIRFMGKRPPDAGGG